MVRPLNRVARLAPTQAPRALATRLGLCAGGGCSPEQRCTNRDNERSHHVVEMDSVSPRKGRDHGVPTVRTETDDRGANDNAHHPGNPLHELHQPSAHAPLVLEEQGRPELRKRCGLRTVERPEQAHPVVDRQREDHGLQPECLLQPSRRRLVNQAGELPTSSTGIRMPASITGSIVHPFVCPFRAARGRECPSRQAVLSSSFPRLEEPHE